MKKKGRRKGLSRVEDFALYVVISIGILAAVALLAVYTTADSGVVFTSVGFGVMTVLVFGDTIRIGRRWWAQRRFWLLLGISLVAQCALGIALLWTVPKVSTMLWAYLIPLDYVALGAFLGFFLPDAEIAATPRPKARPAPQSPPGRVRRTLQALRRPFDDFFDELP